MDRQQSSLEQTTEIVNPQKQKLQQLISERDKIEARVAKLNEQIEVIQETKNFENGLVDKEGFPREDIDFGELSHYRNLKRQRAELNNDHKALMKRLEEAMFAYHETLPRVEQTNQQTSDFSKKGLNEVYTDQNHDSKSTRTQGKQSSPQSNKEEVKKQYKIEYLTPFAKITLVEEDSPASSDGIRVGDLLSEFCEVNIYTPNNIKQIPSQVTENKAAKIVVMRRLQSEAEKSQYNEAYQLKDKQWYAKLTLSVVPRRWGGKGLLGCKIDPLS